MKDWAEIIKSAKFPAPWEEILWRRVRSYQYLREDDKVELKHYIHWFIASKNFEGCGGLVISDEIKVTIAAQACLLLLHRETPCYEKLRLIRIYPAEEFSSSSDPLVGEWWNGGVIQLSWRAVCQGALNPFDGENVVLHEFAHSLDDEDGEVDGIPLVGRGRTAIESAQIYARWAKMLAGEFEAFRLDLQGGAKRSMDGYGSTDPSEFFAVATEHFFEQPLLLIREHPDLFEALKEFYRQDPSEWAIPGRKVDGKFRP